MPKKAMKFIPTPDGVKFHFFASSVGEWRTGKDVEELVKLMRKGGLPFNLFYVPLPEDAEYSITMYAPKVDGALFLGFWGFDE